MINHYKVIARLGKGGMGEVYAAEDTRLKRKIAIKVLPEDVSADPARAARFKTEAQSVAALNHPNIVTIFSVEESGSIHFLTMELVEGDTLASIIPKDGFDVEAFLRIAIPIADALCAAHEKGIIHRDLKPANIMVSKEGRVKVLDFGLAKLLIQDSDSGASSLETVAETKEGTVIGTLHYMSPEQLQGKKLDSRSDIFSLGIIFFEMITGGKPFLGDSTAEIISSILRDTPEPITNLKADIPEQLDQMIKLCLMKHPNDRYQTVRDIYDHLKELSAGSGTSESARSQIHDGPRNNLPDFITHFIGRSQELTEIRKILSSSRLLTVCGTGGSGKTRLAIEAAGKSLRNFSDGVWFINLAPISSGDLVLQSIATALNLKEEKDSPLLDIVVDYLRDKNALLIMDNCEHVLDETAAAINVILQKAPNIKVLAASRESLNLAGEQVWFVPPLSLPSQSDVFTIETVKQFDAIQLFIDRAKSIDPRFTLTETNLDFVVKICRRLDGIPLAIELAAARIKAMSVVEIHKRLDDCFRLLTSSSRASLQRHQTLRAAVDWSYDLLPESERILFRRLSCFSGFDLEAVENVCGYGELNQDDILDSLVRLVDKSLVVSERSEKDSMRYRMLEPLRQYAVEKLAESSDATELQRRHFDHYANMADRAYDERNASSTFWLERLERDHDNLRSAILWASKNSHEGELRLIGAVVWFWFLHGHISEGRQKLQSVLKQNFDESAEMARALWGASMFASMQADHSEGRQLAEKSIEIWRKLGNTLEVALALEPYGWSLWFVGDNAGAYKAFEESLEQFRKLGNEKLMNRATLNICQVLVSEWEVDKAEPLSVKALEIARKYDEPRDIHSALHYLADCALIRGDVNKAAMNYVESLRAAMKYGDRVEIAFEIEGVAMSLAGMGRDSKALCLAAAVTAAKDFQGLNLTIAFWSELKRRYLDPAEIRIGHDQAAKLKQEGAKMSLESAAQYALDMDRI